MTIIRTADAPHFELPGLTFTGLAAPSRGSAGLCTWRLSMDQGHTSPAAHVLDRDEVFMVSRGRIRVRDDGDVLETGDAVVVPAGTPIQVSNAGDTDAEVVVAITAGFVASGADGTTIGTPPWAL